MSGVSMAVTPQKEPEASTRRTERKKQQQPQQAAMGGVLGSFRVIELQLVAFIMVFSASGIVPLLDLAFPVIASSYVLALSRFAFPVHGGDTSTYQEVFHGGRFFRFYLVAGITIGLFLPLAYVLGGFSRGDNRAVRSVTPHLFLLSCQILTENVISGLSLFSPPVRALVPLLYTVRRIFVIFDWVMDVWFRKPLPSSPDFKDMAWSWFGKLLAMANLVYFSLNLFGFLIPKILPRAFEVYFKERDEIFSKTSEDKRSAEQAAISSQGNKKSD